MDDSPNAHSSRHSLRGGDSQAAANPEMIQELLDVSADVR